MKPPDLQKKKSALQGFLTSYSIKSEEKTDPKVFFENNKNKIVKKIRKQEKPAKMKFLLECKFSKEG